MDIDSLCPFYEKVAFGIEEDVENLITVKGEVFVKVDHRLERRP